ncbi:MBL fold metallo-hydrolase [Lachnospiraceae bacterium OttesenSCG-928-J05]|nr:MBL fold metallo-hydrolase [Lachnospiraceae bacterium OttesenSCG-928-J05]
MKMRGNRYNVYPINETTFAIEEKTRISQGLCYLLCGKEKALLIDTGLGFKGLRETVKGLTSLPVIVANTHAHIDHIRGNHFFEEIWFHQKDKGVFALHTDRRYTRQLLGEGMPVPVQVVLGWVAKGLLSVNTSGQYHYFGDEYIFHLGEREVAVVPTPGHTPGSVCFLDRSERLLFSGDTLCEWGVLLHLTKESCPPQVFGESMQRLQSLEADFDTIWPGHHSFPVDKSYIDDYLTCARQIVQGKAQYGITKGRRCAKYNRVLITVPAKEDVNG